MNTISIINKILSKSPSFIKMGLIVSTFFVSVQAKAQDAFKGFENLFTVPANYVVKHTLKTPVIDGDINEGEWRQAQWTTDFVDIEGDLKPKPPLQTNIRMLWDDSTLYVAARMYDPQVWAKLKNHDDVVFRDNDFELFIDPLNTSHHYYEIEVNALNTIFDLFLPKPYRNGGMAVPGWDAHGLRTAVKIQGTLNNPTDTDKGWTVEMAIPFKALSSGFRSAMPKNGTMWRINFSRVQYNTQVLNGQYVKLKDTSGRDLPEHNWVWSPQGVINMHYPERWGYLLFSDANDVVFEMPYTELQKRYLWLIYYRQKAWFRDHHQYALKLGQLDVKSGYNILKKFNNLRLEATAQQFIASVTDEENNIIYTINQDGFVGPDPPLITKKP
jgi:hypothetical protein